MLSSESRALHQGHQLASLIYIYIYTVYTDNKPTPGKAFEDASVMLLSAVATQAALKQIACENNAGKPYGFGVAKTTVFVALNVDA